LKAFAEAFAGRYLHQLHAGEIETWIFGHKAEWSQKSFHKRLLPLFKYGIRHRWLSENPMLLLKAPDAPADAKSVYTGKQFNELLFAADFLPDKYLLPFIVLTGFCWLRTSELVRQYASKDVLAWEDIDWQNNRIHVREGVGKSTRRKSGNERFPPINEYVKNWLAPYIGKATGRIVPVLHGEFAAKMRKLHASSIGRPVASQWT
jgi:integrase